MENEVGLNMCEDSLTNFDTTELQIENELGKWATYRIIARHSELSRENQW